MRVKMFARLVVTALLIVATGCGGGVGPQEPEEAADLSPQSSTIQVTTTADEFNFNADCSLREAIYAANLRIQRGACDGRGAGRKTIVLRRGVYELRSHTQSSAYDYIHSTLPVITGQITIEGNNSTLRFMGDADEDLNLITVAYRGSLHLDSLFIRQARSGTHSAIDNSGTLTARDITFLNNRSSTGHTVKNSGRLTLSNCTFYQNHSSRGTAGIYNYALNASARASVTLTNCNIRRNTSDYGVAALYNTYGGVMKVRNSAVVENHIESYVRTNTSARGVPSIIRNGDTGRYGDTAELELENVTLSESRGPVYSALANFEEARITHSTIYKNHSTINAKASRGIYNFGDLEIGHTVVAHHQPRNGAGPAWSDCMGTAVNSIGYNFQSDGSCAFDATGDIEDDWGAAGLTDLGRYGSLTPIHRHVGWLLYNAGAPRASTSTDQHGDARVQDGRADIGAYEMCEDPEITWVWFFPFRTCDDEASLSDMTGLQSLLETYTPKMAKDLAEQITK